MLQKVELFKENNIYYINFERFASLIEIKTEIIRALFTNKHPSRRTLSHL